MWGGGIPIALIEMVAELNLFEHVCPMFRDSLPTVNRSCVIHQNRVLGVQGSQSGGIPAVECLVSLLTERTELLGYLWIDRVFYCHELTSLINRNMIYQTRDSGFGYGDRREWTMLVTDWTV
jgi:hypothetical protein